MNWKITLTLFIIVAVAALLFFSNQGKDLKQKYLDKYITIAGNFFKGVTGKLKGPRTYPNNTFEATITSTSDIFKGQNFDIENIGFNGKLEYNTITIGGQNINVKDNNEVEFNTDSMTGTIMIDTDNVMRISGQSTSVELNGIVFSPKTGEKTVEFSLVGKPVEYTMTNFYKEKITLSGVSGLLTLKDWSPLTLKGDSLEITNFLGTVEQTDSSLTITGKVEKVRLNNVDLLLSKG
ncbi:MAG: hypothetical protein NTW30_04730 [Candidatus Aenigmarchaeota archaeon]|nr:hypothetical protein [Candidatus Aenigmarchaeota archaeon]